MFHALKRPFLPASFNTWAIPVVGIVLAGAGCSSGDPDPADSAPKVAVPEINGAVAAEDFCGLADQIHCAGAVGCCSDSGPAYASVDECIQKSSCRKSLDRVLQSSLAADGTLVYSADAAGDYLRALAANTSVCGPRTEPGVKQPFLIGTRDEGADCSPQAMDATNTLTCKPGLECSLSLDALNGVETGTCTAVAAQPSEGACASEDDCSSGLCKDGMCTEEEHSYCAGQPIAAMTPPPNVDPTYLYIDLSGDNSGTSGDVKLLYANGGKFWTCTITDTLADGQEKVCKVTGSGTVTNSTKEFYQIEMSSNDGMKVDTVCACSETSTDKLCKTAVECFGSFFDPGNNSSWSDGCGSFNLEGQWCDRIWLDGDGHGNCTKIQVTDSYSGNSNWTNCY